MELFQILSILPVPCMNVMKYVIIQYVSDKCDDSYKQLFIHRSVDVSYMDLSRRMNKKYNTTVTQV
jgi:hypothetical protein